MDSSTVVKLIYSHPQHRSYIAPTLICNILITQCAAWHHVFWNEDKIEEREAFIYTLSENVILTY